MALLDPVLGLVFGDVQPVRMFEGVEGEKTPLGKLEDRAVDVFLGEITDVVTETSITFDTTTSETVNLPVTVPKNPIEAGGDMASSNLSDNRVLEDETISITAIISDTRISDGLLAPLVGNVKNLASKIRDLSAVTGATEKTESIKKKAFDKLVEMRNKGTLFTLVTGLKTTEGLWITDLTQPRTADKDGGLEFSLTFQKPQFAVTEHGTASTPSISTKIDKKNAQGLKQTVEKKTGSAKAKAKAKAKVAVEKTPLNKIVTGAGEFFKELAGVKDVAKAGTGASP